MTQCLTMRDSIYGQTIMTEPWDEDEDYFVYEEVKSLFAAMTFERISHCAGLLCLKR